MSYIVMDLSGDTIPFFQCGQIYFRILFFQQILILLFQHQCQLSAVISGFFIFLLQFIKSPSPPI